MCNIQEKKKKLRALLKEMNPIIVAFSGGVDSSYLLAMAVDSIGKTNVIAVTARAPFFSPFETQHIKAIIRKTDVRHIVFDHEAMSNEIFTRNSPDRCYHCKKMIFTRIRKIADSLNIKHIVHGNNTDDLNDYRPGSRAAQELCVKEPLVLARLSKANIINFAKEIGLSNWNQSAMACLATRIPFHSVITEKKLIMIHQAELALFNMGFSGGRVRLSDRTARVEIRQNQLKDFLAGKLQDKLFEQLRKIGFLDMIIDMKGYQENTSK
jgi:uncharacterized protein